MADDTAPEVPEVPETVAVEDTAYEAEKALLVRLAALDARAKEQGHSLEQVLVKAAQAWFGIDITPVEPATEA